MIEEFEASVARIFSANGTYVVGTGFYIGDGLVVTCAHVITQAIFGGNNQTANKKPKEIIDIDFPLSDPSVIYKGSVVCWVPMLEDGSGDIAVIKLNSEVGNLKPVLLATKRDLWGHSFRAYGCPHLHSDGLWVSGKISGRQANGWMQIEVESAAKIEAGFSGAGIWDHQLKGVTGIIVRMATNKSAVAFIIPVEIIINNCPRLKKYVISHPRYLSDIHELPGSILLEKLNYYRSRFSNGDNNETNALAVLLIGMKFFDEALYVLAKCISAYPFDAYLYYLMSIALIKGRPPRFLIRDEALTIRNNLLKAIELDQSLIQATSLLMFINRECFEKKGFLAQPPPQEAIALLRPENSAQPEFLILSKLIPGIENYKKNIMQ
jgi:hypothetical protein